MTYNRQRKPIDLVMKLNNSCGFFIKNSIGTTAITNNNNTESKDLLIDILLNNEHFIISIIKSNLNTSHINKSLWQSQTITYIIFNGNS